MPFINGPIIDSKSLGINEVGTTDVVSSTYVSIDDTFYEILKNHTGVVANMGAITNDTSPYPERVRMDTSYMFAGGTHGISGAYSAFVYNGYLYTAPYQSITSGSAMLIWYKYEFASKTYTKFTLVSPYTNTSKHYYIMINHQIGNTCKFYGLVLTPGDGAWVTSTSSEFSYIADDVIFDFDNNTITKISKFPTINTSDSSKSNLLNMFHKGDKTYIGVGTIQPVGSNYQYYTGWSDSLTKNWYVYDNSSYTKITTSVYIDIRSLVFLNDDMTAISINPGVDTGESGSYTETLRYTTVQLQNMTKGNHESMSSSYNDFNNNVTVFTDKIFPENKFTDIFKRGLFYDFSVYMAYQIPGVDRNFIIDYTSNRYYGGSLLLLELIPSDNLSEITINLIANLDRSDVLENGQMFVNTPFIDDGYSRFNSSLFKVSMPMIPDFSTTGVMYGANSIYDYPLLCKYQFNL